MREFKGLLIGDAGVGKDSILNRLIDNHFPLTVSTIGAAFRIKYYPNAKLSFWNTSGQRRYKEVIKLYFRNTDVCIIVYDISSKESFDNCKFWLNYFRTNEIKENSPTHELSMNRAKIYILANKIDLPTSQELNNRIELLHEYAKSENIIPGIVSAKTSEGITDFFDTIMSNLMGIETPKDLIEMDRVPVISQNCHCIIS